MNDTAYLEEQIDHVTKYLFDTYSEDDALRLAQIKAVQGIVAKYPLVPNYKELIAKVALFNGIEAMK